jgi:hypothetical protein
MAGEGMRRRTKICVYCGEAKGTTRDHVIPGCLFVDPKPANLLTVPACLSCNNVEKSADDTFLRDLLAVDIDNEHPVAESLRASKVRRSVERNLSEIARIIVSAKEQPRHDHEGNYLGEFPRLDLPKGRVSRIMSRIVRGLYYCSQKEILPSSHGLTVLRQPTPMFPTLYDSLGRPEVRRFGEIFGYTWVREPNPLRMIWLLWFYESVVFSVSSSNPQERS